MTGGTLAEAFRFIRILFSDAPVISTVVAIVSGRYIWTWWRKPALQFHTTSTSPGFDYDSDEWDNTPVHFRIHMRNIGLTAANNCKPKLELDGRTEGRHFKITTPTCWSEGEYPARQTINRGENISFEAFRQLKKDGTKSLRFPSEQGWPEYATITERPTSKQKKDADGLVVGAERNTTPTSTLERVEWETAKVIVTSENADAVEAEINFEWDREGSEREDLRLSITQTQRSRIQRWREISSYIRQKFTIS